MIGISSEPKPMPSQQIGNSMERVHPNLYSPVVDMNIRSSEMQEEQLRYIHTSFNQNGQNQTIYKSSISTQNMNMMDSISNHKETHKAIKLPVGFCKSKIKSRNHIEGAPKLMTL
jgi:hypothetical protein